MEIINSRNTDKSIVNFIERIKATLLNLSPQELSKSIRSTKSQDEAMFLFWALDYLDQHQFAGFKVLYLGPSQSLITSHQSLFFMNYLPHVLLGVEFLLDRQGYE